MPELIKIDNYTPWQATERRRIIALIEKEKRYFHTAVKPYIDMLASIESKHSPKYYLMPDADG